MPINPGILAAAKRQSRRWLAGGISPSVVVAAYEPKGAQSLAASYINLANPGTSNAAAGVAPVFATGTGWSFNGTAHYLTTGIIPAAAYSMIVHVSGVAASGITRIAAGLSDSVGDVRFYLAPTGVAGTVHMHGYGDIFTRLAPALISGTMAIAGPNRYINGVADGSGGTWASPSRGIMIGAGNERGTAHFFCECTIKALYLYSATLTAPQVLAVHNALGTL